MSNPGPPSAVAGVLIHRGEAEVAPGIADDPIPAGSSADVVSGGASERAVASSLAQPDVPALLAPERVGPHPALHQVGAGTPEDEVRTAASLDEVRTTLPQITSAPGVPWSSSSPSVPVMVHAGLVRPSARGDADDVGTPTMPVETSRIRANSRLIRARPHAEPSTFAFSACIRLRP